LFREGEAVVEAVFAELRVESAEGLLFTDRYPAFVDHEFSHGGKLQPPFRPGRLRKTEVWMKPEAHRDRSVGTRDHRYFDGEAVGAKHAGKFDTMAKRKHRKKVAAGPFESSRQKIVSRLSHYPGEQRPWHTVHRKPMLIEMQKRR